MSFIFYNGHGPIIPGPVGLHQLQMNRQIYVTLCVIVNSNAASVTITRFVFDLYSINKTSQINKIFM